MFINAKSLFLYKFDKQKLFIFKEKVKLKLNYINRLYLYNPKINYLIIHVFYLDFVLLSRFCIFINLKLMVKKNYLIFINYYKL